MVELINRFRKSDAVGRSGGSGRTTSASDLPLDHRVTFKAGPDEQWTYEENGRIQVNDVDIEDMIDKERSDIQFLCGVSRGLQLYQLDVWSKGGKGMSEFNAKVGALQEKIHFRLTNIYERVTGGINFELQSGEFWVNNINVRKAIQLFYQRPTEKVRIFLMGLRDKLALILSGSRSSNRYDGVEREASALYSDICLALEYIPADAPPRLVARDGRI